MSGGTAANYGTAPMSHLSSSSAFFGVNQKNKNPAATPELAGHEPTGMSYNSRMAATANSTPKKTTIARIILSHIDTAFSFSAGVDDGCRS
jgi:hypothetical protein